MMAAALHLGWCELIDNRRMVFVMSQVIAVALLCFLTLYGYRNGLKLDYSINPKGSLIVQQSDSVGEFYGSRLSTDVGQQLREAGVSQVIPEIHDVTGTSIQDAALLRGVSLQRYTSVEDFTLLDGRSLQPGDEPRLAMIGRKLAEIRGVGVGDIISLRGRNFTVVGVFEVGTYVDNEAWISLEDAQALLGWGDEVSVYIVPDEGVLHEGQTLGEGISVVRKGEAAGDYVRLWSPLIDLMSSVALMLALVAAVTLTNILWRLARLRQRELAIMRSLGFGKFTLFGYLLVQAAGVVGLGWLFGFLGVFLLAAGTEVYYLGQSVSLVIDSRAFLVSVALALFITLGGVAAPVWWLNRLDVATLLRSD